MNQAISWLMMTAKPIYSCTRRSIPQRVEVAPAVIGKTCVVSLVGIDMSNAASVLVKRASAGCMRMAASRADRAAVHFNPSRIEPPRNTGADLKPVVAALSRWHVPATYCTVGAAKSTKRPAAGFVPDPKRPIKSGAEGRLGTAKSDCNQTREKVFVLSWAACRICVIGDWLRGTWRAPVEEYHRHKRRDRHVLGPEDFSDADLAAVEEVRAPESSKAFDHEAIARSVPRTGSRSRHPLRLPVGRWGASASPPSRAGPIAGSPKHACVGKIAAALRRVRPARARRFCPRVRPLR